MAKILRTPRLVGAVLGAAALLGLSGCVAYPDDGYSNGYGGGYATGPSYYGPPLRRSYAPPYGYYAPPQRWHGGGRPAPGGPRHYGAPSPQRSGQGLFNAPVRGGGGGPPPRLHGGPFNPNQPHETERN